MSEVVGHARILQTGVQESLSEENRHYLERVLRLRPGDPFVVTDGAGRESQACLGHQGVFTRRAWCEPRRELPLTVSLFLSLIKGDRFEWALEKAVELGVTRIVPVQAARCVVRDPGPARHDRWRKVMIAAMLQCGGCVVPSLEDPIGPAGLPSCSGNARGMLLDAAGDPFPEPGPDWLGGCAGESASLAILSGPEGGFTPEEVTLARERGWRPWSLGPRRLRAETAPLTALARLAALLEVTSGGGGS